MTKNNFEFVRAGINTTFKINGEKTFIISESLLVGQWIKETI